MPSKNHRTTSRSGGSQKSRTTTKRSPKKPSSPTRPASFESIFGRSANPEESVWRSRLAHAEARLKELQEAPVETLAYMRTKQVAAISRYKKTVKDLKEVLSHIANAD